MARDDLARRFSTLTTPHLADACLRAGVPVRCAPAGTRPVVAGSRLVGRALPARHAGSVDVFLEALENALPGDVLVVDNDGRDDEACVGDLIVHETHVAGGAGLLVWGLHRDTADIIAIGLPVFSLGAFPSGPLEPRDRPPGALSAAQIGDFAVTTADFVVADDDGALFIPAESVADIVAAAEAIRDSERQQAERIRTGQTLRDQVRFASYLAARAVNPDLTFRKHLRSVSGAIEE